MNETDTLIDQLKVINKKKSYEKMAREMGVSSQTVYRWIKGRNSPSGLARGVVNNYILGQYAEGNYKPND